MKKILLILAFVGSMLMAGGNVSPVAEITPIVVKGDSGFYVGAGVGALGVVESINFDEFGVNADGLYGVAFDNQLVGVGVVGYNFCKYAAVEGRYTGSLDDINYEGVSVFGKFTYANESKFAPYVLLGGNLTNFDLWDDKDSWEFSAGVGGEYALSDKVGVFGDYVVNRFDGSDIAEDVVTVGVKYNF